uniref:hypothetical protein n=1 Tax=Candidatus Ichthyocystis sparus TaxID=1561004 RepID=UPI001F5EFFA3
VGVPESALSISQRLVRRGTIRRRETQGSSSGITSEVEASGSGVAGVVRSQPELSPSRDPRSRTGSGQLLLSEEDRDSSSSRFVRLLSYSRTGSGQLLLSEEDRDSSSSRFVRLLSYRDQLASLSTIDAVSISDESSSDATDDSANLSATGAVSISDESSSDDTDDSASYY